MINLGEIDVNSSKALYENMDQKEKDKYDLLIEMLPVISDKSIKSIFAELKSEGVEIPEEIINDRLKKFAINRQMIERYFIYHKGVEEDEIIRK